MDFTKRHADQIQETHDLMVAMVGALFQDPAGTDAAVACMQSSHYSGVGCNLSFTHYMVAGAGARTYKIRFGSSSAGTFNLNGNNLTAGNAARILGGVMASSITITEFKP